jgi:hypothetical protein
MSKTFINSLADVDFMNDYKVRVQKGRFTLVNCTTLEVNTGGAPFVANLELTSDFQAVGANVKSMIRSSFSDYSGINNRYVGEDGVFNAGAALSDFAKNGLERRVVKEDTLSILSKHTQVDSHEAFIYNMLVTWLKAELYTANKDTGLKLKVANEPYTDSHVRMRAYGTLVEGEVHVDLGPPVDDDTIEGTSWVMRDKDNYWDRPYVLHYNASDPKQETFYLYHVLGRNIVSPLNFEVAIPGLDSDELLLDPVNSDRVNPAVGSEPKWDAPNLIWMWIMDYVTLNRLEQQFASALELLGAVAFQPRWTSMEATWWGKAQIVVTLPEFSPTRARIRTALEGDSYVPSALAHEFMVEEAHAPRNFLMSSAYLNYAMWYGYYTIFYNAMEDNENWRDVFGSTAQQLHITKSPAARAGLISMITGKEKSTCFSAGCGMFIETQGMAPFKSLPVAECYDGTVGDTIPLDYLPAPVSGNLILGTCVSQFTTTAHLAGTQYIPTGMTSVEYEYATSIANIYRLFGHEVTFRDMSTGEDKTPWAPVHDLVIEPGSIGFLVEQGIRFKVLTSRAREGRNLVIDPVIRALQSECFNASFKKPVISINEWRSRKRMLLPSFSRRVPKAVTFKVKANFTLTPNQFTPKAIRTEGAQDFGEVMSEGVARAPVDTPSTQIVAVPIQAETSTAETAA